MITSPDRSPQAQATIPPAPVTRDALQARFRILCAEIRDYPTPIARCDEQLSGLIEERNRIAALLKDA